MTLFNSNKQSTWLSLHLQCSLREKNNSFLLITKSTQCVHVCPLQAFYIYLINEADRHNDVLVNI